MSTEVRPLRNTTYTGGNSDTLPFFSYPLSVSGLTNRWIGANLPAVGSSVASWAPQVGSVSMVQATAGSQPISAVASGLRVLRTDGVDDTISTMGLTPAKTISMVVRMLTAAGTTKGFAAWDGGYVSRGSTGTTSTTRIGASALTQAASIDQPLFHVVTIINDFAGGVGATVVDGLYGTQATDRENANLILGRGSTSSWSSIEVLDVAIWGTKALTSTECQNIRNDFKAAYPGLIA